MARKENIAFYFSVEGETEKWYLEWLANTINGQETAALKVKMNAKVQKNPVSYIKQLTVTQQVEVTHLMDIERPSNLQSFKGLLDKMDKAQKSGKSVIYQLGYSNLSFDLWMILHKDICNASFTEPHQYLEKINKVYNEKFASMEEYKQERNFKRLLSKLSLDDVKRAIGYAENIERKNAQNYTIQKHKEFKYYVENPSLSINVSIKKILEECKLT